MPAGVYVMRDVPTGRLPLVVAGYRAEGATVTTTEQPNGKWTVVAVFPAKVAPASVTTGAKKAGKKKAAKKKGGKKKGAKKKVGKKKAGR